MTVDGGLQDTKSIGCGGRPTIEVAVAQDGAVKSNYGVLVSEETTFPGDGSVRQQNARGSQSRTAVILLRTSVNEIVPDFPRNAQARGGGGGSAAAVFLRRATMWS